MAAEPATITVSLDGRSGYRSIGAALVAAPDGAIISVEPGRYAETLTLTRPVGTITAAQAPGTVVVTPSAGAAVTLTGGSATLRGICLLARTARRRSPR